MITSKYQKIQTKQDGAVLVALLTVSTKASLPICRQIPGIFSRNKPGALENRNDVKVLIFEISGLL